MFAEDDDDGKPRVQLPKVQIAKPQTVRWPLCVASGGFDCFLNDV